MKTFVLVLCIASLTGCTALESRGEQTWLALHAVDTAQTYRIAQSDGCFREGNPITSAVIGEEPSTGEALAWGIGTAALHVGVTELLLRNDHPKLAKAWQFVTIGASSYAIGHNYSLGIRIGGPNEPKAGSNCAARMALSNR
jgi:hypothetical protein